MRLILYSFFKFPVNFLHHSVPVGGPITYSPEWPQNNVLIFHMDEVDRRGNDKQVLMLY